MKRKCLAVVLTLAVLALVIPGTVLAEDEDTTYYEELEGYVALYNSNLGSIPAMAKRLFAGERINFYISHSDGEEVIGVATSGTAEIVEFQEGELENPTLLAYIDGEMIDAALENPSQKTAMEAVNSIRLEGVGIMKKIKVVFLNLARMVAGWFL